MFNVREEIKIKIRIKPTQSVSGFLLLVLIVSEETSSVGRG